MKTIQSLFSNIWIFVVLGILIVLVIVLLVVKSMKKKSAHKAYDAVLVRYNDLKTKPLGLKLSKAQAIARINPEDNKDIVDIEQQYEQCQNIMRNLDELMLSIDDALMVSRTKEAMKNIEQANDLCDEGDISFRNLEASLDKMLEQQTKQRSEIVELKEQFRHLKQVANENSAKLSFSWDYVEKNISLTEKMFGAFEDWTYAAEYEKANSKLVEIKESMGNLNAIINELPSLLEQATGTIPQYIDMVSNAYNTALATGINMKHLNVEQNLNEIRTGLREDLIALKNGEGVNVKDHLATYKHRLVQLAKSIKNEDDAYKEWSQLLSSTESLNDSFKSLVGACKAQLDNAKVKFDIENADGIISNALINLENYQECIDTIKLSKDNVDVSASSLVTQMKEVKQRISSDYDEVKTLKSQLDTARSDEDRAKKQLLKLQVVVNEMQVKIRERKLTNISEKYEEDVNQAFEYIYSIERELKKTNIDLNKVNITINEANDFIYRLYNDVNNVVGTAVMVENAIVFGNRYRSTYQDVDSDLTRAELCFRNGEYTNALKLAIATIEKLHPNTFESLIKGNATSAN